MPEVIGIAGGSASGKSRFAREFLQRKDPKGVLVPLDSFYRDRSYLTPNQRLTVNFDHPRAIDWDELIAAIDALIEGQTASIPVYNFERHGRVGVEEIRSTPQTIVVEGLWALRNRKLRSRLSFKIYVDCPRALRLERRLKRDAEARGRTRADIERQFNAQVDPAHQRFVEPQKAKADAIVSSPWSTSDLVALLERRTRS